jgi:hypothetical protein
MIAFLAIFLALQAPCVAAFDLTACSSENTGTDEVCKYISAGGASVSDTLSLHSG